VCVCKTRKRNTIHFVLRTRAHRYRIATCLPSGVQNRPFLVREMPMNKILSISLYALLGFFLGGSVSAAFMMAVFFAAISPRVSVIEQQLMLLIVAPMFFCLGGLLAAIATFPSKYRFVPLAANAAVVLGLIALAATGRASLAQIGIFAAVACPALSVATWLGWQLPKIIRWAERTG
jgi:hypothetical protein